MHGLTEQRLIIQGLESTVAVRRIRLLEAFRNFDPPVDAAMVVAGTALIAADIIPGIAAVAGVFTKGQRPSERLRRILKIVVEAPRLVQSVRRLLP